VEVMSMDRKLCGEARAIAARHGGEAAEDLAQDLLLAALEGGAGARNPAAWMERVGRNAAIDRWRVARRREELAGEIELPVEAMDPESALLYRERRGLLRRALAALPPMQRRATIARFHGELPFEEIAARVGTEPVTARTRVHRALASLRARLAALRAMLVLPGAQTAALGLTLLVAELPGVPRPAAIASTEPMPAAVTTRKKPVRIIAAASEQKPSSVSPPIAGERPDVREVPAVQKITFDHGDQLLGETEGPEWAPVTGVLPAKQPSLIELRQHFVPEMVKALEDL
jgi:RNA polymerase sigma-70 factor (ECF subfamily)